MTMKEFLEAMAYGAIIALAAVAFWVVFAVFPSRACAADLALGDSIVVGVGQALHVPTQARVGASSCWVKNAFPGGTFDHVVISVGINDPPGMCAAALRYSIHSSHVVWILPAPINSARLHIAAVAASFNDLTVPYWCLRGCTKTRFHPGSYAAVAALVRVAWRLK